MIKEIVDMKNGDLEIAGISQEDLDQIQEYLCTQWWFFFPAAGFHPAQISLVWERFPASQISSK